MSNNLINYGQHWKRDLNDQLWYTFYRCSIDGWDGADAEPISLTRCKKVEKFLKLIPEGIMAPTIVPETGGQIALDWQRGRDCIFSVGFEGANISFAGYFGEKTRVRGNKFFWNKIPRQILSILKIYFHLNKL